MRNYLISIIWVSVIVGIVELISPRLNGFQKYTKMIGALCVLCVVISPLLNIKNVTADFDYLKESLTEGQDSSLYDEYKEILNKYLNEYSLDKVKEEIHNTLSEKFRIPESEAEIRLFTEIKSERLALSKIQIILSGKSIFNNPYKIEDYFGEIFGCACEVLIN